MLDLSADSRCKKSPAGQSGGHVISALAATLAEVCCGGKRWLSSASLGGHLFGAVLSKSLPRLTYTALVSFLIMWRDDIQAMVTP